MDGKIIDEEISLKKNMGIPETSDISLEDLRKAKADIDISGSQLIVEGEITSPTTSKVINDSLKSYLEVYKFEDSAITGSPFLYTLMRMLIGHSEKLDKEVREKLPIIMQKLGKENYDCEFDIGKYIYEWLIDNDPDALGEYHL